MPHNNRPENRGRNIGFGLSKTKMLVATGELRSLKDGKHRRILPEWVDEYIERRVKEGAA
jgi:excisionase family DNA binding protein